MNLLADKEHAARKVTVYVSVCWMMLFYFKLANIIRMLFAEFL